MDISSTIVLQMRPMLLFSFSGFVVRSFVDRFALLRTGSQLLTVAAIASARYSKHCLNALMPDQQFRNYKTHTKCVPFKINSHNPGLFRLIRK